MKPFLVAAFACLTLPFIGTGLATAQQNAEQLNVHAERVMIRGLTWLQNGYPDRAAAVFSEGLKVHQENAALLASMATAQQAMGELGSARFYLDQALQLDPEKPALISQDLDLALAAGDLDASSRAVNRLLEMPRLDPYFLLRHLTMLIERGSGNLGSDVAARGLELFPGNVDMAAAALRVFTERGETTAAIQSARNLVELRGSFDDRLQLARLLMQAGRWPEAADTLGPLFIAEPDDPELLAMMADLDARLPSRNLADETGIILPERDAVAEAAPGGDSLTVYRSAWEAKPDDEDRVVELISFLIRTDRAREAALLADEHVEQYPRHLRVWTLTMDAWLAAGNLEEALFRSEDAILLFPGYPPVVLSRARTLAATGNLEAASDVLSDLLARIDADSAEADAARRLMSQLQQPQ